MMDDTAKYAPLRKTAAQLVRSLERAGFSFRSFSAQERGSYTVADADWNYKDVTHAAFVHNEFDGYHSWVSDNVVTLFFMQKLGPLILPLSTVLYISQPDRQTYHTAFGPVILIIETVWAESGPQSTTVTTTYSVGIKGRALLAIVAPLIKWLVLRNNTSLMEQDLAMRRRRGDLRDRNYLFQRIGDGTYAYRPTMRISDDHVTAPPAAAGADLRVPVASIPTDTLLHVGDDAAYGLQLRRSNRTVEVYPRLCPHEGACLDANEPKAERVHCPWHGRAFRATKLSLESGEAIRVGGMSVRVDGTDVVATPTPSGAYDSFDLPPEMYESVERV